MQISNYLLTYANLSEKLNSPFTKKEINLSKLFSSLDCTCILYLIEIYKYRGQNYKNVEL